MNTGNPIPRGRGKRLAWVAAALAVVVAAILIVTMVLLPADRPSSTPTPSGEASTSAPATASPEGSPSSTTQSPSAESAKPSRSASVSPTETADAPAPGPTTRSAVPLDKKADVQPQLSARVSRLTAVNGVAQGPGEVAGPSIRATISLTNDTAKSINLANTVVNLYYGKDETPASVLSGPGAKPLPPKLKVGDTASGVFVFSVPKDSRSDILITVDYSVKTPVVAFRGPGPR